MYHGWQMRNSYYALYNDFSQLPSHIWNTYGTDNVIKCTLNTSRTILFNLSVLFTWQLQYNKNIHTPR